jgi:hypothetical protein
LTSWSIAKGLEEGREEVVVVDEEGRGWIAELGNEREEVGEDDEDVDLDLLGDDLDRLAQHRRE